MDEAPVVDPFAGFAPVAASVDALPELADALPEPVDVFLLEAVEATTVAKPELNPSTVSLDELAAVDVCAGVPPIAAGRVKEAAVVCEAAETVVSSGVEQILKTCNVP